MQIEFIHLLETLCSLAWCNAPWALFLIGLLVLLCLDLCLDK